MEQNENALLYEYPNCTSESHSDTVLINKGNVILSYSKCQNGEMNSNFISNYNISELSEDTSNLSLLGQPLDDDIHSDSTLSPVKKGCDYKCRNGFIDGELLRQLHSENGVTEESCKSQNDIFSNSSSESLNASDSNSSKSCNQVTVPQNINEFVDGCVNLTNKCASENSSVKNINSKVNLLPYPNENYGNGELSPLVDVENFLGTTSHFPVTKVCSCDNSKDVDRTECIEYVQYESELQMPHIMRLIQKDLSEPYSIYTYRYFIHNWPELCFLAKHKNECVGAIVCKLDHHNKVKRGYIAMLAVDENFRKKKIGSNLVHKAIKAMVAGEAGEIVLETEITNKPALKLYENLGFVRDKRLFRYYLNGVDALRLKLWIQ